MTCSKVCKLLYYDGGVPSKLGKCACFVIEDPDQHSGLILLPNRYLVKPNIPDDDYRKEFNYDNY